MPLDICLWHAVCVHAEFFDVVHRVMIRMVYVAVYGAREYSAAPTVAVYNVAQMAGLVGVAYLRPYDAAAQLVLQ